MRPLIMPMPPTLLAVFIMPLVLIIALTALAVVLNRAMAAMVNAAITATGEQPVADTVPVDVVRDGVLIPGDPTAARRLTVARRLIAARRTAEHIGVTRQPQQPFAYTSHPWQ